MGKSVCGSVCGKNPNTKFKIAVCGYCSGKQKITSIYKFFMLSTLYGPAEAKTPR